MHHSSCKNCGKGMVKLDKKTKFCSCRCANYYLARTKPDRLKKDHQFSYSRQVSGIFDVMEFENWIN